MKVIDTPIPTDDIITACDRLITSLGRAASNGRAMKIMLTEMKEEFLNAPFWGCSQPDSKNRFATAPAL